MPLGRYTTEQLDYPGDGRHYLDGKPFTGTLEFRSPDGQLEAEEEFRSGQLSGMKRARHRPGALALEAECSSGASRGRVRRWHESGGLESDAVYEYGIRLRARVWDEGRVLVEDFTLAETDPALGLFRALRKAEAEFGSEGSAAEPPAAPAT